MSSLFTKLSEKGIADFIKYGLVGLLGLIVDMGVFYLLNKTLHVNYVFSNLTSSSLAVIHNFVLNSYFTFKVTDNKFRRFLLFYLVALIGMAFGTVLLALFIDVVGLDSMLAKLIAVFIVAMCQFFLNKKLTFRKRTQ